MKARHLVPASLPCVVCGSPEAFIGGSINGCPGEVPACGSCRQAVIQREVGIVKREDGSLHVTDGRDFELTALKESA